MKNASFNSRLEAVSARTALFDKFLALFAQSLTRPIMYHSGEEHFGFRYLKPELPHFCLLKAARAVSALNASVQLAKCGYTQEIAVLIRTIIEYTTHIEYVLVEMAENGTLSEKASNYVRDYFADYKRNSRDDFKKAQVPQKLIHESVGKTLNSTSTTPELDAERLMSNVYLTFSNYVHGKYPEAMDMYNGELEVFSLSGMDSEKKDEENLTSIETFEVTVSQALARIVLSLNLAPLIEKDREIQRWYMSVVT